MIYVLKERDILPFMDLESENFLHSVYSTDHLLRNSAYSTDHLLDWPTTGKDLKERKILNEITENSKIESDPGSLF